MTKKPHAPLEDTAIIRLYNARDERAISETDRKYGSYCMAVSMNILDSHPDAEECVNDAYLKLQGTEGTRSYGLVVDLAVAYDRKMAGN